MLMRKIIRKTLGWLFRRVKRTEETVEEYILNIKPSPKDKRDEKYALRIVGEISLPKEKFLTQYAPPVKNQGRIGSCGSHAICSAVELSAQIDDITWNAIPLSERFHYYVVRQPEFMNTFPRDSGQYLRDGMKVAHKVGISPEALCPYEVDKFNEKPGFIAYGFARLWKIKSYHRLFTTTDMKAALNINKPVVVGLKVRRDLYYVNKTTGLYEGKDKIIGGHAMLIIGYSDNKFGGSFLVLNSWGERWGKKGKCWIPYNVVQRDLIEAWTLTT